MSNRKVVEYRGAKDSIKQDVYMHENILIESSGVVTVSRHGVLVAAYSPRAWVALRFKDES